MSVQLGCRGLTQIEPGVRDKFGGQIQNSDALIFAVPLVNLENTDWIQLMSELIDNQKDKAATSGIIALQAHAGPPMTVQFKDVRLKELK